MKPTMIKRFDGIRLQVTIISVARTAWLTSLGLEDFQNATRLRYYWTSFDNRLETKETLTETCFRDDWMTAVTFASGLCQT